MKHIKIELYLMAITAILKFIMMDWLSMRAIYITFVCFMWLIYIYYRQKKDKTILQKWGFQGQNFLKSFIILLPFALVSIASSLVYGGKVGYSFQIWHILLVLILYLVWGTFQQFIVVGLIVQNLTRFGKVFTLLIGSCLFCLIHSPDILLMTYTFIMEILFILVFLKFRNLWALGIVHGIAATFLLYFVQNRDLLGELLSWFG